MFKKLDHLIVAVTNLEDAKKNYKKLFGISPIWEGTNQDLGTSNALFYFDNIYFELLSSSGNGLGADLVNRRLEEQGEGLFGIAFAANNIDLVKNSFEKKGFLVRDISNGEETNISNKKTRRWKSLLLPRELSRGIFSFVIEYIGGKLPQLKELNASSPHKLDHVVINTNDADGFIKIYRDTFNIRLALDKFIEHWQKRMLFFRLNKTTIEVIEQKDDLKPNDKMWGLAWEINDIEKAHARLVAEGIEVTPVQKGIKEKTLVATIKSHNHNVPTLLIQHLD